MTPTQEGRAIDVLLVEDDPGDELITREAFEHNKIKNTLHVTRDDFYAYVVLEGDVELSAVAAAPDDDAVAELVDLYRAMLGEHPDWDDYRATMVRDRRVVVRLRPTRAYGLLPRPG